MSLADRYLVFSGAASTLLIFNQISVGTNLSLLWLMVAAFPVLKPQFQKQQHSLLLLLFLSAFAMKFMLFGNVMALVRYLIYIACVVSLLLTFEKKDFRLFFQGVEIGLALNVGFAAIQMVGMVTGAYNAVLKVSAWNPFLWHQNPPGGMFTFWPRVSGFTNEPAYLGLLFVANAAYRIFIADKQTLTGRYGLYLLLVILLLVNSRTAFYGYICLGLGAGLLRVRNGALTKPIAIAAYAVSFIIMPAYLIHGMSDFRSMQELLRDDVSVFARAVPLSWIMTPQYFTTSDYMFGVGDYTRFTQGLPIPGDMRISFVRQGMFSDSKSLGGAYFYDLGILGSAAFMLIVGTVYRWRIKALLFFAVLNVGFFNVYAFSWPLFWVMLCVGVHASVVGGKQKRPLPRDRTKFRHLPYSASRNAPSRT